MAPDRRHLVTFGVILGLAACLIFAGLDEPKLWMDEAETALLARSILHHGIPKAVDGHDVISQEVGREFRADGIWRWTPWLDKYVAAASFLVLGEGTLAARFPFALVGLAAVASMYPLAWSLFRDRRIALVSMAALILSVPFLLHVRECRYYAFAILGFAWALRFTVGATRGERGSIIGLVAAMTVLFHSNYLIFVASSVALAASVWILGVDRAAFRRLAMAAGIVIAINAPWALFFDLLHKQAQAGELESYSQNLEKYALMTAVYGFPPLALVPFAAIVWRPRRRSPAIDREHRRPVAFLGATVLVYIVVVSVAPWSYYRYIACLLPLFAALAGWISVTAFSASRLLGAPLAVCLLATGVFHQASSFGFKLETPWIVGPGRSFRSLDWGFPLGNFVYELTHRFTPATDAITDFLASNAQPGDQVYITYGDLVLRFYLKLDVRGGQSGQSLADWRSPKWVVLRGFALNSRRAHVAQNVERMKDWAEHNIQWELYRHKQLPQLDQPFEKIPEPDLHWFRQPDVGQPIRISRNFSAP